MAYRNICLKHTKKGKTLYHYTKSNGITGIINNNCFFATKSDFLNDPNEFLYTKSIVEKVVFELAESEYKKQFLLDVMTGASFIKNSNDDEYFVLSFSSCRDSITMWSEFGSKTGYNIGMNSEEIISRIAEQNEIDMHGFVIYDESRQKELIANIIKDDIEKEIGKEFNQILLDKANGTNEENYEIACSVFREKASLYAMFFKNNAFKEEEEYRFVFKKQSLTQVKFRVKDGFIIPYIEIWLSDKLLPIKEIMVAPENHIDLAKNGMEYMMKAKGYDVPICLSDIKLRY